MKGISNLTRLNGKLASFLCRNEAGMTSHPILIIRIAGYRFAGEFIKRKEYFYDKGKVS